MIESLGDVVLSSGTLVVIDFGLLNFWSHSEPQHLEHGDPDLIERVNSAIDFEIVGPDALAVAAKIDLAAAKGTFVFDMPADSGEMVRERVAEICRSEDLEARVMQIGRMPHAERTKRLVLQQPTGVEVMFDGGWAVAAAGLPSGTPLPVRGTRMPEDSPDSGRWHSVWLEVGDGEVVDSIEMGYVLVDEARLMFCDLDLLGEWEHDESLDGLYDLAFWGRDAEQVAESTGAQLQPTLGAESYGWVDIDLERTREVAGEVFALQQAGELKFAADVRPHSHHHDVLKQTAESPTESGVIELAGGRGLGFFTSWGDGAFPIYRDVDAAGKLLRVRIEIGNDQTVARFRRMDELWFGSLAKLAAVSAKVANGVAPVGYLYREETERENDSGWCVLSGDESDEFLDDPANIVLMPLRDLIGLEDSLEKLFSLPPPAAFERSSEGALVRCDPPEIRP